MRDSTIFYRSFYDAIKLLPKKYQLAFYESLFEYMFNDAEPERLTGSAMALFKALKPQIDVNNKRYENGCKGGRPKANQTETKPKPNNNQTETKPKPNNNQTETKPKPNYNDNPNVNLNPNDNDNHNDNAPASGSGGSRLDDEFNIWKMLGGDGIDQIYDVYPESGGLLLQEVYEDIKAKKKKIKNPVGYVLGYAKNVGWVDDADHFAAPWEAS